MFVIHLLILIAAFLGVDLDDPLTPVANSCSADWTIGFEDVPKGNYSENWYTWESCLLGPDRHEATPVAVADAEAIIAEAWADYLHFRNNPKGPHAELWRHAAGCGRYFRVVRDTASYEILEVAAMDAPPPEPAKTGGPA